MKLHVSSSVVLDKSKPTNQITATPPDNVHTSSMVALSLCLFSRHLRAILHSPLIDDEGHLPLLGSTFVIILYKDPALFSAM